MKQSAKLAVPATLFAAGAFASPGQAAVVDITASASGTSIDLVGNSRAEYEFYQHTDLNGSAYYTLEGKAFSGNQVGPYSASSYYPQPSAANLSKTQTVTDGYYGLSFTDGSAGSPEYTGYAKVDQGGSHISEIDFWAATAVPETGTWAMMILGLGAAGAMMRRRRQAGAPIAA